MAPLGSGDRRAALRLALDGLCGCHGCVLLGRGLGRLGAGTGRGDSSGWTSALASTAGDVRRVGNGRLLAWRSGGVAHSLSDSWLAVCCLGSSVTRCTAGGDGNSLAGDDVDGVRVEGIVGRVHEDHGVLRASWLLDVLTATGDSGGRNSSSTSELELDQLEYRVLVRPSVASNMALNDWCGVSPPTACRRACCSITTPNRASISCSRSF